MHFHGYLWETGPRQRLVSNFSMYMNKFRGRWAFTLVFFSKFCPRLSVLSWVHFWLERGVVNRLWFLSEASYRPGVLCEGSQGVLLWSFGGGLSQVCVGRLESQRYELAKIRPSEVDRGIVNLRFLSLYWSDIVLLWCRPSQEHLLQSYVGGLVSFASGGLERLRKLEVRVGKNLALRGSF